MKGWKYQIKQGLRLYLFFFKIGCFTFGGGWSMVAQMQKEFAEQRHMIDKELLLDITSVGRSLPGTMIGNVSFMFGYHIGGPVGGIMAVLGIVSPSVLLLSVITFIYQLLKGNIYVERMLLGVRASVIPVILDAAVRLRKSALKDKVTVVLAVVSFLLFLFSDMEIIWIIFGGAGLGILIMEWRLHAIS